MSPNATSPQLVEGVVDGILYLLKTTLVININTVQQQYPAGVDDPALEPPGEYFVSEKYVGLRAPAIFVLPVSSTFRLDESQNFIYTDHSIQVVALVEEIGDRVAGRLARKCWRYNLALWLTLNDQDLLPPAPPTKLLVKASRYSPILKGESQGEQVFRKETWLEVMATTMENFQ